MITFAAPLPIGNAVRVLVAPAAGAVKTRILRKTTDDIANENDSGAGLIYEGEAPSIVDVVTLINGTPYYYRAFDLIGSAWVGSPSVSATPAATGAMLGPDPLEMVRSRLEAGLKVEVAANRLVHVGGYIPCLTAPPLTENVKWPVVTVHLRSDAAAVRGLGEIVGVDEFDEGADLWTQSEGWLSRYSLEVIGWTLNPDERIALRKAIKKVVIGNLPVFAANSITDVELSQSDVEDFESYNAPVYQSVGQFSCTAPSIVDGRVGAVDDVTVDAEPLLEAA